MLSVMRMAALLQAGRSHVDSDQHHADGGKPHGGFLESLRNSLHAHTAPGKASGSKPSQPLQQQDSAHVDAQTQRAGSLSSAQQAHLPGSQQEAAGKLREASALQPQEAAGQPREASASQRREAAGQPREALAQLQHGTQQTAMPGEARDSPGLRERLHQHASDPVGSALHTASHQANVLKRLVTGDPSAAQVCL